MANLFGAIFDRAKDLVSYPIEASYKTITNPKEGLNMWKDLYTHNTHEDQDLFQNGFGIRGWVGDHPQESAAAVVASIFGGWAAGGAYGAGAAGGAGGAAGTGTGIGAGGAAGTSGALSGLGGSSAGGAAGTSAMAYMPTQSSVLAGTGAQGIGTGAGTSAMAYAPTQSTVLGGVGSGMAPNYGAGLSSAGSSGINVQQLMNGINQLQSATGGNQGSGTTQQVEIIPAKVGNFNFQPTQSDYSKAQQLLSQTLGTNPYNTNPFNRR